MEGVDLVQAGHNALQSDFLQIPPHGVSRGICPRQGSPACTQKEETFLSVKQRCGGAWLQGQQCMGHGPQATELQLHKGQGKVACKSGEVDLHEGQQELGLHHPAEGWPSEEVRPLR